jgi:hypothetical protein
MLAAGLCYGRGWYEKLSVIFVVAKAKRKHFNREICQFKGWSFFSRWIRTAKDKHIRERLAHPPHLRQVGARWRRFQPNNYPTSQTKTKHVINTLKYFEIL